MSSAAIASNLSYLYITTMTSPGVTSTHFVKVGEARTIGLTVDGKEIDVTSHDSAGWEEKLMGNKTWSMAVSEIFVDSDTAQKLLEYSSVLLSNAVSAFKSLMNIQL